MALQAPRISEKPLQHLQQLHQCTELPDYGTCMSTQRLDPHSPNSPVLNPNSALAVSSAAGPSTTLGCWSPEAPDHPWDGESIQGAMGSKGQSIILKHWKTVL